MFLGKYFKKIYSSLAFIILAGVFLEMLTYFPLFYWGFEVQQAFKVKKSPTFFGFNNEMGAYSFFRPANTNYTIATFGNSIMLSKNISTQDTWPVLLEPLLKSHRVHTDNYAIGQSGAYSNLVILDGFIKAHKKYDLVIFQNFDHPDEDFYTNTKLFYANRWIDEAPYFRAPHFLQKWWERRVKYEKWILSGAAKKKIFSDYIKSRENIYNREFYQSPTVQKNLIYQKTVFDEAFKEKFIRIVEKNIRKAKEVSQQIIWMPTMVLNPHMIRESYKNKYVSVIKVREKTGGIYYHNPESLYEFFIEKNKIIEEYLTKNHPEVVIVNYYPYLESLTSKYDNLFIDEYHMTSLGNKVVAEFVARKIDEIIFRKESKNDTRI